MPGTIVLEDDGLFIMAAYFNGIAHPPGYPLYTIMAHLATWLPFGSVAYRVHMLSGLFAALACVILWVIAFRLFQEKIVAYATALSFGFSQTFWSQSIIAEVYTLNVLLISLLFIYCLLLMKSQDDEYFRRKLNILFLLYGLALSNHWPLLVLSTPMFIALLWPQIKNVIKQSFKSMPFLMIGLLPYLWMVIRSNMDVEISFYGPIESWNDFWFYVSRQGYKGIDDNPSAGLADKLHFITYILAETPIQFGAFGIVFLLGGLVYQFYILKRNIILALILGYSGSTVILICLLGFDYDLLHRVTFRVYPLVAYFCASIWVGMGVAAISKLCVGLAKGKVQYRIPLLGFTILATGSAFASNLPQNYRSNDFWTYNYAMALLDSLPANAVLFLSSDEDTGPLGYMNRIEGYRKDVLLYHAKGQVFKNRLYQPFKANIYQVRDANVDLINSTPFPVYYTNDLIHDYGNEYYGLYSKVLKDADMDSLRIVLNEKLLGYLEFVVNHQRPNNQWEAMHYQTVVSNGCRLLSLANEFSGKDTGKPDELKSLRKILCDNLQGIYIQLNLELESSRDDLGKLEQLVEKAQTRLHESRGKAETALLYHYQGEVFYKRGNYQQANNAYQQSIKIWNHPDNPSNLKIKKGNLGP